jgi:NAD(P)-dependent dehydrogenase (short-subunit alcohol dehydrogenase family)
MTQQAWLITGVSSGFGRPLAEQILARGDRVVGSVRRPEAAADLVKSHPGRFRAEILDVTDAVALREVVDRTFADLGRVDVVVSNAGYGLFGAGEEYTDDQIRHIIDSPGLDPVPGSPVHPRRHAADSPRGLPAGPERLGCLNELIPEDAD